MLILYRTFVLKGKVAVSSTDDFLLALRAYQQVRQEMMSAASHTSTSSDTHEMAWLLEENGLPEGMLLLGVAEGGRLLAIDLYDPHQGAVLITGDGGCGKTTLLHALAVASADMPDVQFGVLSPFPEEWRAYQALPKCLGVWPANHPAGVNFLAQLAAWSESLSATHQVILLLVDNFDLMSLGRIGNRLVSWLVCEGPAYRVWPVFALNPARLNRLGNLLPFFQTRIFGHVRSYRMACWLTGEPPLDLGGLIPGLQFYLSSPQGCELFWIPPLEGVLHERWNAVVRQR